MSASAVSITANTAARRRPVVINDKKSNNNNIELVSVDPQLNGVGDDKPTAAQSKDLSRHSIRGEAVVDKDTLVQVKKSGLANSTVSPRRSRKSSPKPEKPRWATVVSIFTKNFLLLVAVLGLGQMIRRVYLKSGDSAGAELGFSEFERRITEVENFLKTTTKMMQLQVEVLDRKVESEMGGLRREVSKSIDDKSVILERELKKLEEKSEGLERTLSELKAVDWLSKEEFEKFFEEFKKQKSGELSENDVSLDDIRVYAREIVEKEIEKHAADGLGRVDYALATSGAFVIKHSDAYLAGKGSNWLSLGSRNGVHSYADKMLKPSFGEPGQCFPLKGSSGFVQIKLRTAIIPEAITLEHVAKSVAYDRSSAPKDCRVSGWLQGDDSDLAVGAEKMFLLTEFAYDLDKSNAQTFNVLDLPGSGVVDTVRLDFTSNHGSSSHTCIYRLRVHGRDPDSVSVLAMQS
ncbi:SUN domain-containing protein 1 [Citrus sinensis]|uniref:SUN domain-containing protein 1 n=1 Tax=Citrus sinensis TaxID=2711 RepID=UPI00219E2C95|nr:SUN domain-containing protein 1 [Citrus sinensis]KAH9686807.1 SUN domain-containing protein 1 [Citrus sinensis]